MQTITLETVNELVSFENSWTALTKDCAQSVFQMPGWVIQWFKAFGRDFKPNCIAVTDGGKLVGFAPLMISELGGTKLLEFAGSFLNDYNAFLASHQRVREVGKLVFRRLADESARWDLFKISAIEDFKMALGVDNFDLFGLAFRPTGYEQSPSFNLPSDWTKYLTKLPQKRVRCLEDLKQRLLLRESCQFNVSIDPTEIVNCMDEFESNRLRSWQFRGRIHDLPPLITTKRFSNFLKALGKTLPTSNGLHFAFLKRGTQIIAAGLYFSANARLMKYMQSWNCDYARMSPGTVLDWLVIQYAIEKGFRVFDFGQGDEPYKFRFGAKNRPLQHAVITPTGTI